MIHTTTEIRRELLEKFQKFCGVKGTIDTEGSIAIFDPDSHSLNPFLVHFDGEGIEFVQLVYPDNNEGTPRDYDIIYKCKDLAELKQVYNVVSKAKIFKW